MNSFKNWTAAADQVRPLAGVILCDEYESGCKAKALLDQIVADTGDGIEFNLALWRIDNLARPDTSIGVFRELSCAAILALALRSELQFPNSVLDWVGYWANCRSGSQSALVVLGNPGPAAIEAVEKTTKPLGISIFCEQSDPRGLPPPDDFEDLRRREATRFPVWQEFLDDLPPGNYRDWGLNE